MLCLVGILFILIGMFSLFARDLLAEAPNAEEGAERREVWTERTTCLGILCIALGLITIIIAVVAPTLGIAE